ncbi:MAG: hypothetical protein WBM83_06165 [Flavobacteriaceae bacterium]
MKKIIFACFLVSLFACNDGDLQIETVDFDSILTVDNCGDVKAGQSNVVFKINSDEALILTLPAAAIKNEVSDGQISSAVPGSSEITYRIFSDNVAKTYFCSAIPLTEPTVIDEIEANGGEVLITTTTTDSITFTHAIELSGISLLTSDNSRITDLRIDSFGEFTTSIED